jgi:CRP-like cAMP-binding protein
MDARDARAVSLSPMAADLPSSVPTPILDALPAGPRARLAAHLVVRDLESGTVIMREGEPTDALAIVVSGRVALRLRIPERGPVTILTLEAGDMVGWSALVAPYRATATAVALEPTRLAVVGSGQLRELLAADAELAAAFLPHVLAAAAARVTATRDQLLDLFRAPGPEPW